MINIFKKQKNRKIFTAIIFAMIIAVFFIGAKYALASDAGLAASAITDAVAKPIATVLSWIAWAFIQLFGLLLTLFIAILVNVAKFNNIINVPTVIQGWVIIRDLCNMSFILILLIIAFATILRQENFSAKKLLPKLLIMAVLINFSRTIFGLLIDASQIVMLTFVNGFAEFGRANFVNMFQTQKILSMWTSGTVDSWAILVAIIAGVIALLITNIVVLVMIAVLVMRIIMFWIYTIFSPLVFLGFAIPAVQKYTGKIWEDFTKQLVVGPVLAFFIWLALATVSESSNKLGTAFTDVGQQQICAGIGALFCEGSFQTFIITIGLLMGGLMVAQQMGGAAASIAGKGLDWGKKVAGAPVKFAGMGIGSVVRYKVDNLQKRGIVDLNLVRAWHKLQESRKDKKARWSAEGETAAKSAMEGKGRLRGLLAMTAAPGDAWEQISSGFKLSIRHPFRDSGNKGIRQRLMGGKKMTEEREKLLPGVEQAELEDSFSRMDDIGRDKILVEIEKEKDEVDDKISKEKDLEKKKVLEKEKERVTKKYDFAYNNYSRDFSDDEKINFSRVKEEKKEEYEKYIPLYAFEAKSAEEKAVSLEMDKIKRVDDKFELVRMMGEAMHEHEKSRIKAIARKLTADYNDNEFLDAFVPEHGTGYKGLQALMDGLSTKGDKNYAGFDRQEAYSLGAQIAEMNKKTNHWANAAAFKMERGEWKKTSAQEHVQISSGEFGKRSPRNNAREFNRLAMGIHKLDKKIGKMIYELEPEGLVALQSWDNSTSIDRMLEDMTESTAKYLLPFLNKLEDEGFFKAKGPKVMEVTLRDGSKITREPNLPDVIRIKANEASEDFSKQFNYVSGISEKINS